MPPKKSPYHSLTSPREWFALFFARGGWWVIGCAGALLAFAFFAMILARNADRFDRDGVIIKAVVVSQRVNSWQSKIARYVTLKYHVLSTAYSGTRKVSITLFRQSPMDAEVDIRHLKTAPAKFEYPIGATRTKAVFLREVALFTGAVALGLLCWRWSQTNAAVKTRRYGEFQIATVTGVQEHDNSGTPTGYGYMIWALDNGKRGESLTHDMATLRRIGVGAKINVYVRDDDSFWEGDVGPRREHPSRLPKVRR